MSFQFQLTFTSGIIPSAHFYVLEFHQAFLYPKTLWNCTFIFASPKVAHLSNFLLKIYISLYNGIFAKLKSNMHRFYVFAPFKIYYLGIQMLLREYCVIKKWCRRKQNHVPMIKTKCHRHLLKCGDWKPVVHVSNQFYI